MAAKLSTASAIAAVIASTFGTGILFMPCGFKMLGIGNAIIAISIIAFTTFYTLYSLAHTAVITNTTIQTSYSKLARALSPFLGQLVDFMLVGRTLGTSLAITRCFASSAAVLLRDSGLPLNTEIIRKICVFIFILAVTYFLTRTRISSLSFIPKISLLGVFFYITTTAYYALFYGQPLSNLKFTSNQYSRGFIKFIFALHCQSSFLNIFNEMETQDMHSVLIVASTASASIATIYALSGFLGYLAVGDEIGDRHMLEVIRDRSHPLMKRVASGSFDKIGSLPIVVNLCFLFVWFGFVVFAYFPLIPVIQDKLSKSNLKVSRLSIVIMVFAFLFVGSLPQNLHISKLLDINAALFTNPLGFVLPSLFAIAADGRCSLRSFFGIVIIFSSIFISTSVIFSVFGL